jgi:hypothetical protein
MNGIRLLGQRSIRMKKVSIEGTVQASAGTGMRVSSRRTIQDATRISRTLGGRGQDLKPTPRIPLPAVADGHSHHQGHKPP